jgi:hypothetical protein
MRFIRLVAFLALCLGFLLGLYSSTTEATLKYKKETGKKCSFCHTGVPRDGDEDKKLNADGKLFKDNGYRLTEEQKKKPD